MAKTKNKKRKKNNTVPQRKMANMYYPLSLETGNYLKSLGAISPIKSNYIYKRTEIVDEKLSYLYDILEESECEEYEKSPFILEIINRIESIISKYYTKEDNDTFVKRHKRIDAIKEISLLSGIPTHELNLLMSNATGGVYVSPFISSKDSKVDVYSYYCSLAVENAAMYSIRDLLTSEVAFDSPAKLEKAQHYLDLLIEATYSYFVKKNYQDASCWSTIDHTLRYRGDSQKLFFVNKLVEMLTYKQENVGDEMVYGSVTKTTIDWMFERFMSDKTINCNENFDLKEYIRTNLIDNEQEMIAFIIRNYSIFERDIYNLAECELIKESFELKLTLDKRFKEDCTAQKKEINSLKAALEEVNKKIQDEVNKRKEAESLIHSSVKNATKQQADENASLRKKLKEYSENNDKLSDKIAELEAQVNADEESETDESASVSFDLSAYLKIKDKRIVFVRSKFSETFAIFSEIVKAFPNAKFVDAISDDFNAKATDCVVLMTRCMKHYTYWDMKNCSKASNVPFIHCNHLNLGMIANLISEELLK